MNRLVGRRFESPEMPSICDRKAREISDDLRERFKSFQTSSLVGVTPVEFGEYIKSRIGVTNPQSEGYSENEIQQQRDLSIKFHWGHNHDFGDFRLKGRMGDRHINVLANFMALFSISFDDFLGKHVFDIGCWTGGSTLLLSTLSREVFAIEEVRKYSEMTSYLVNSFGIKDRVSVQPLSIYGCNSEDFHGLFDIVYFPGVIYHLSDPVLGLRVLFNSLKVGGFILVESKGVNSKAPICRFEGSLVEYFGSKEKLDRGGWNWFVPSPSALRRMMKEAGFDEIEIRLLNRDNRIYGYGRKVSQVGICKAGLSVPNIK